MARKTQPVNILPYPSSSDDQSEDEEGSISSSDDEQQQEPQSEEEESGTGSDDEQQQEPQSEEEESGTDDEAIMPVVNQPSLQQPQESVADSFDSQNSPSASAFTVMPIVPQPISKSPQPETPTSKTIRAKHPLEESEKFDNPVSINQEPGKTQGKRPVETETENIYKVSRNKKSKVSDGDGQSVGEVDKGLKGKKVVSGDGDGGKIGERKSIFKWSEENEIVLLLKIIDYKADTGNVVNSTMDAFYEYVKDSISVTLTKTQLYEKNRRLKNKFQTNVEKWQNGGEPVFSRPHEKKLFDLSQKIWGSEGTLTEGSASELKRSNKTDKKDGIAVNNTNTERKSVANRELPVQEEDEDPIIEDKKEETQDFWSMYPLLSASLESEVFGNLTLKFCDSKEYVKTMISRFGEEKARELEDGWKAVHVMDVQLYAKRVHLINEQAQAAVESLE